MTEVRREELKNSRITPGSAAIRRRIISMIIKPEEINSGVDAPKYSFSNANFFGNSAKISPLSDTSY